MIEPKKLEQQPEFFWDSIWDDKCHEENWELIEVLSAELIKNEPDDIIFNVKYKQCEDGKTTIEEDWCRYTKKYLDKIIEVN
ncbi:MAG: hypothetical protein AAFQ91_18390 [Cyanobacteria bacterium J06621_15]